MPKINKKYNVVTRGNRENQAILLLHGIGADHLMWHLQIDVFADKGYFVIAPDLLGHGETENVSSITLEEWNKQILDILNSYSIDSAIRIGVSMGGVIAQSFAIKHQHKVNQLILSDTICELESFKEKMFGSLHFVGFRIFKLLGSKMFSTGIASSYNWDIAYHAKEYFTSSERTLDFQLLILARKAINKADFKEKLTDLNVPSLVLVGN